MKTTRQLTEVEQQFVKEAEAGGFGLGYDDNGSPFAHGAEGTDNLFSMEVEALPDGDGGTWCYFLPENDGLGAQLC